MDAAATPAYPVSTPSDAARCGFCGKVAPLDAHPCAFERACLCWFGAECGPESDGPDSWERTARIMARAYGRTEAAA